MTKCPQCDGPASYLGRLGTNEVLRCRNCGWQWSEAVSEDEATPCCGDCGDALPDDCEDGDLCVACDREDEDHEPDVDEAQEWADFDPDC